MDPSSQLLESIVHAVPCGILIYDSRGKIHLANDLVVKFLASPGQRLIGTNVTSLKQKTWEQKKGFDFISIPSPLILPLEGGPLPREEVYRIAEPETGVYRHARVSLNFDESSDPEKRSYIFSMVEIPDPGPIQAAHYDNESILRGIVENTSEGISLADSRGFYLLVNEAMAKMTGYTRDELLSMKVRDLVPRNQELHLFPRVRAGRTGTRETHLQKKDGTLFLAEITGKPISFGGESCVLGLIRDVTEERMIRESLKISEERYRSVVENLAEGIVIHDRTGAIVMANSSACQILGLTLDQLTGRSSIQPDWKCIHDDGREFAGKDHPAMRSLREGVKLNGVEMGIPVGHDRTRWILINSSPLRNGEGGEVAGAVASFVDVTESRETRNRLVESEERYRLLADLTLEGIAIHESGLLLDLNESMAKMLGYRAGELLGEQVLDRIFRGDSLKIVQEKIGEGYTGSYEVYVTRKDGSTLPVEISVRNVNLNGRRVRALSVLDLTERKKNETILRNMIADREALLRELTHRTRNNMNVISSYLQLQSLYNPDEKIVRILEDIDSRIQAMALVHRKIYETGELSRIQLKDYLEDLLEMIRASFSIPGKEIRIRTEIPDLSVLVDLAIPLGLVINELVTNSFKHAFSEKDRGEILVTIRKDEQKEGRLSIEVCDDGCGLKEGFDPVVEETVGLMTMRSIVREQLDGEMDYRNRDGLCWFIDVHSNLYGERVVS